MGDPARAHCGLRRALARSAELAGAPIAVGADRVARWSSGTFEGGRHVVELHGAYGPAMDAWLGGLGDTELRIPGHLVADLVVSAVSSAGGRTDATLEALTVAEL
ncbi:hypothetical protein [Sphingomonas hengshuiensis]|uniref:Uncharacterized protein n=1 Tax=Sphingomonas hengshuiensis TaxID=1609977 RepID=A0A7U4J9Y5_9SPHN|nr:hypothetical protein [Sphingomonas hengshuiensis]AJP72938.1 hypothetical protein TS85_15780 [Sphingomonas hengshuiensis]